MRITIETDGSNGFDKELKHNDKGNQGTLDAGESMELGANQGISTDPKLKAFDTADAINGGPPDQGLVESIGSLRSPSEQSHEKGNSQPIDAGKAPDNA